jgi:DNA-3-methyladenine glycosylase
VSTPVGAVLPRSFYDRDPRVVAPELLGKVLVHGDRAVRIVEVEAYIGADDPASHAYRGQTARTRVMFGPPGHLYVYFTYGMHWCANAVCGPEGEAAAVLLRAGEALSGLAPMRHARPAARTERDLANGPAKLCQAMGIDGAQDGVDLVGGAGPTIVDDGVPPPPCPGTSGRVGISVAVEHPWRWFVRDDPHVSPGRPGPPVGRRVR